MFLDGGGEYFKSPLLTLSMLLLLILFSGCASPIDLSEAKSIPKNEGVVFGRLKAISDGEIQTFSTIFGESTMSILILPDGSSKGTYFPLKDEGFFFLHLPPGGYTIASFEGHFSPAMRGRIFAHFDVFQDEVTYIGTVTLVFAGARYRRFVEDEYEVAIEQFREKFPEIKREPRRSLMVLEKQR